MAPGKYIHGLPEAKSYCRSVNAQAVRLVSVALVVICLLAPSLHAATPEQVEAAIAKAQKYLITHQKNGNWELAPTPDKVIVPMTLTGGQWSGYTAIATLALLASGENPQSETLKPAIKFLLDNAAASTGTYATGVRAQIWPFLKQTPEIRAAAQRDLKLLLNGTRNEGPTQGKYGYLLSGATEHHSPSQYAVLGVWAGARLNLEVSDNYWALIEKAWRQTQAPSGGWCYRLIADDRECTASMTGAGVATLFIAREMLLRNPDAETYIQKEIDPAIDKGIKWMVARSQSIVAGQAGHPIHTLYSMERIGLASGMKYFGTVNWYQAGADLLVKTQQAREGYWNDVGGFVPATALGILFLARGRAPVVINKLQYASPAGVSEAHWNQYSRDAAHLAEWIGEQSERHLNWQIVNLDAPVDELFDSQILYISGDRAVSFSDTEKAKLKQYALGGGIILGHANAGNRGFSTSFTKLGRELFPDYSFRDLSENHPIYTAQLFPRAKWGYKPKLLGLSNGIRELMLLIPEGDIGRTWHSLGTKKEHFQLGADILFYSVDRDCLYTKGKTYVVHVDPTVQATRKLPVFRIQQGPNWDPEPVGWERLAATLHNQFKLDLCIQTVALGQGKLPELAKDMAAPAATQPAASPATRPSPQELRKQAIKHIPSAELAQLASEPDKLEAAIRKETDKLVAELNAAESNASPASATSQPSPQDLRKQAIRRIPPHQLADLAVDPAKMEAAINKEIEKLKAEIKAAEAKAAPAVPPALARPVRPVAHLTGTTALKLTDPQRHELKQFVESGGLLIVDSAGGNNEFALSAEAELMHIFAPDQESLPLLPEDHPMWTTTGKAIEPIEYRSFARKVVGNRAGSRLRGISINGQFAVLFSAEDISAALVGQPVDGIIGYSPVTASGIMTRALLYASGSSLTISAPANATPGRPAK